MNALQTEEMASLILVIEDNAAQLKTLSDILASEGFQPIACPTGQAALAACAEYDAHVAILDLRLPDMDGLALLNELKARAPSLQVIINTAYATLEAAMAAVNQDAFAFVQKMGDVAELLRYVHQAFHAHFVGYSAQLEQEVQKRTEELSAANAALRQEIVERERIEAQITAALQEKEVLLREIHHRTKNNMQVLSALFNFQASYTQDAETLQFLQAAQDRIMAMALVHDKLYQADLTTVNLKEYIAELAQMLFSNYQVHPRRVGLILDTDAVLMTIDTAVPCGLMINELLANAVKHAFPENRSGEITVALHVNADGVKELRIRDNGVGLPADFDLQHTHSLGFRLVKMIAELQLQGAVSILRKAPGTEVIVRFKERHYPKRI